MKPQPTRTTRTTRTIQPIKKRPTNAAETTLVFMLLAFAWQAKFILLGLMLLFSIHIQNWQTDFKKHLNTSQATEWKIQRNIWHFMRWDTHFKGVMGK